MTMLLHRLFMMIYRQERSVWALYIGTPCCLNVRSPSRSGE
jgi:hypothetical protein